MAADAIEYTASFFLPAMLRVSEQTLPGIVFDGRDIASASVAVQDGEQAAATMSGAPIDVLLAMWGRPHGDIEITGSEAAVDEWKELPSKAFQFGTWD